MKPHAILSALAAVLLAPPAPAEPFLRTPVTSIRPLLTRAIDQGEAHGVLTGEAAARIARRFDSAAPIEIDVHRLHALPQEGCTRLEVSTRQAGVLQGTTRADQAFTWELDYCRDGTFPARESAR